MKQRILCLRSARIVALLIFLSAACINAQESTRGSYVGLGTHINTCALLFLPNGASKVVCKPTIPVYNTSEATAFGCDTNGQIELIANQTTICDSNYYPILGGDTVANSGIANTPIMHLNSGILLPTGSSKYYYFLLVPSDSMFYNTWFSSPTQPAYITDNLLVIEVQKNSSGVWQVTGKPSVLYDRDSGIANMGSITTVRHANGKDWWLTIRDFGVQTLVNYLVSDTGIQDPFKTTFPTQDWTDDFGSGAQTLYSYDGSKIVIAGSSQIPEIFIADFNRCTGEYSNARIIKVPQDSALYHGVYYPDTLLSGAALSFNNRYLYVSTAWRIRQVDLSVPSQNPPFVTIMPADSIDYNNSTHPVQWFSCGQNDKIYFTTGSLNDRVNFIVNPDDAYPACSIGYDAVPSGYLIEETSPGPNFMLGPDSMLCYPTVLGPTLGAHKVVIHPNPATNAIVIEIQSAKHEILDVTIYNQYGVAVKVASLPISGSMLSVNVAELALGIYTAKVTFINNETVYAKFVKR
jgi:hypothetical protein